MGDAHLWDWLGVPCVKWDLLLLQSLLRSKLCAWTGSRQRMFDEKATAAYLSCASRGGRGVCLASMFAPKDTWPSSFWYCWLPPLRPATWFIKLSDICAKESLVWNQISSPLWGNNGHREGHSGTSQDQCVAVFLQEGRYVVLRSVYQLIFLWGRVSFSIFFSFWSCGFPPP